MPTARRPTHPEKIIRRSSASVAAESRDLWPKQPFLDQRFPQKLERLTLRWHKSFSGLVGGHNSVALLRAGPGVSRSSPLSSRRRSTRGELARLSALRQIVPENVSGRAAYSCSAAARFQRIHGWPHGRCTNSITRGNWRRAVLCRAGAAGHDLPSAVSGQSSMSTSCAAAAGTVSCLSRSSSPS